MALAFAGRSDGWRQILVDEAGGHRWQRVPPSEKRGRVHTSTITVAVMEEPTPSSFSLLEADLDERFTVGSGKGGQARNRTKNCVVLTHRPSGESVRVEGGRERQQNRTEARRLLRARLYSEQQSQEIRTRNDRRRRQVGSGMRADKIRTVRVQHGEVVDHRNGLTIPFNRYRKGRIRG